jgi:hypothetical protein
MEIFSALSSLNRCKICDSCPGEVHSMVLENGFPSSMIDCLIDDVGIADTDFHGMFVWKEKSTLVKSADTITNESLTVFDVGNVDGQGIISKDNVTGLI